MGLHVVLGIIHYFQHFCKGTESMLGGVGKSSCTLSKLLVLATVPVHETSLANQQIVRFWGGRRGMKKEYTLYACENDENYGWSLIMKIQHVGRLLILKHAFHW